jgi:hypothetical protein
LKTRKNQEIVEKRKSWNRGGKETLISKLLTVFRGELSRASSKGENNSRSIKQETLFETSLEVILSSTAAIFEPK